MPSALGILTIIGTSSSTAGDMGSITAWGSKVPHAVCHGQKKIFLKIHQEGRSQRSAPQRRHTAHLRRCSHCTPRKPSGWDGGGDKLQPSTRGDCARQEPGHLSCPYLGWAQNAGPTKSAPLHSSVLAWRIPGTGEPCGLPSMGSHRVGHN